MAWIYNPFSGKFERERFISRGDASDIDWNASDFTTNGAWHDLDCSSIVPAGIRAILARVVVKTAGSGNVLAIRKNGFTNQVNYFRVITQVANVNLEVTAILECDSDRVVEYWATNVSWTTLNVAIRGWWI